MTTTRPTRLRAADKRASTDDRNHNLMKPSDPAVRCYVLALLTPFLALGLITLTPWTFGDGPFLLPLMVPIVAAAIYGGLLPGLLATLISAIGAIWIIPPSGSFTIASDLNVFRCALFIGTSLLLTILIDKLRRIKHARDIAFAAVQDSRMRFESTFQQAALGMAVVAPDGRWLRVNQKLCDILGYTEQELLSKTFQDLTYPDDLHADLDHLKRMLAREIASYAMEKRYIRQDGSLVWANLTVSLTWQSDGTPDHFISVVEDISDRKRVEAALQRALEQARDANSANRAKSEFLA
ncbi:MAG: PAS domain S-box protein, partial [Spongiibacteraceae bacterium]